MPYRFFSSSEKAWDAMYQTIADACDSIYIEMYSFYPKLKKYDFFSLLKKKASEGKRVRIVVDSLGSRELEKEVVGELRKSGAEVLFVSNFIYRTHRKILIVDESIAYIGGVNFSEESRRWNDISIEVRGRMAKPLARSFSKGYRAARGKDPIVLSLKERVVYGRVRSWLIEHFPKEKKHKLKRLYIENIDKAKEKVVLITPYLFIKRWFLAAIDRAVMDGVKVEVLMPDHTDVYFVDRVNFFYIKKIAALGAQVYLRPKMNHAKAMILDDKEAIIGSHNLDMFSFDINDEIALFIKNPEEVMKVKTFAIQWKRESILFDKKTFKKKKLDYILFPLLSLYSRFF